MAVLEKIRSRAVILVIAIGLGLFAFIFGDVGNWFSSLYRDSEMDAFIVNGNKVKIQDYEQAVSQTMEQYKQMNRNLSEAETQQVRNMVYQTMVSKQILSEEADKIGLTVTPAETFDLVQGDNLSPMILQSGLFTNPETGLFDRAALLNFLKQIKTKGATPQEQALIDQYKAIWVQLEDDIRSNKLGEKYTSLISGAVVANKLELAYYTKANSVAADLAYVQQSVAQAPDADVQVTDADIKAYYDSHKELFASQNGGADLDVIYATITPSASDVESAKSDIAEAEKALKAGENPANVLEDYSDVKYVDYYLPIGEFNNPIFPADFAAFLESAPVGEVSQVYDLGQSVSVAKLLDKKVSPEMLRVSHIMLAPAQAGQPTVDSLLTVLKADPSQFATLAANYSIDTNTKTNGGEITWLNEATAAQYLGEDFSDAIYKATVGVPFAFKSQYGEHIVLVNEAKDNVAKYKVAFAQRNIVASNETQTALYNDISSFIAQNMDKDIDSLALNKGYQVLPNVKVSADQPMLTQGIENSRSLVKWAMSAKPGEVSDITECGDKWVFVRLNSSFTDKVIPLAMVKDQVTDIVRDEKKVEAMYAQLTGAKYSNLEAFAEQLHSQVDTLSTVKFNTTRLAGIGYEPAINAAAAYAPVESLQPLKGVRSVYLVKALNRTEDPATEADTKGLLDAERKGIVRSQALTYIIQKSDIKDRRYKFQ